jgi:hypothetical protein
MNSVGVNQYTPQRRSIAVMVWSWFGVIASGLLLWPVSFLAINTVGALRPCSVNNPGLSLNTCGKASFDVTDVVLLLIFLGVVGIAAAALTHAIRMSRKTA